jgi:two-component system, chemotaxis family, chemotaxis protein CheY
MTSLGLDALGSRPGQEGAVVARVLIVDDNLLCRTLLREILSDAGHEVVGEAEDGLQAPAAVRDLRPEVLTLDLVMPGRSGFATLRHVLAIDPSLAVVVCSASGDQARVIRAVRLGASGFIIKPFDRDTVLGAIGTALADRQRNSWPPADPEPVDASFTRPAHGPSMPGRICPDCGIEHVHVICRRLAAELRKLLETAIDNGEVTLEQLLALEYQELRGPGVRPVGRLFDLDRLAGQHFDPPKFHTAYDAILDRDMMERLDDVLAAEPWLTFAVPLDLNVYAPAHNSAFSRDCTGDRTHDLEANRTKRFFLESPALRRAARMQLGVELAPRRLSRLEIEQAGGRLLEPRSGVERAFALEAYRRDTGAVLGTASVPLYVMRQRWGVVTLGWTPEQLRSEPDQPSPGRLTV